MWHTCAIQSPDMQPFLNPRGHTLHLKLPYSPAQYPRKIKVNLLGLYRDYRNTVTPKRLKVTYWTTKLKPKRLYRLGVASVRIPLAVEEVTNLTSHAG